MAELDAKLFRNYFGGSWLGSIKRNGEYSRDIVFNWPEAFGQFSAIGTEENTIALPGGGFYDDTKKVVTSGWRKDVKRWIISWYNEFGGYGEMQWTSYEVVDNIKVIYGYGHECKQESDDPVDYIILCEMTDENNFKYILQSFRKGTIEIMAKRIRTSRELHKLVKDQAKGVEFNSDLLKYTY